ncbi:MAG: family 20 glycosylhydrolase [Ferruginibacter sp.]
MLNKIIITFCFLLFSALVIAQHTAIIPAPKSLVEKEGFFELSNDVVISYSGEELHHLADYATAFIKEFSGLSLRNRNNLKKGFAKKISLSIISSVKTNKEGYFLEVSTSGINIKANAPAGLFYGIQTLLQLLAVQGTHQILCVSIIDEPRFPWRGMLFDNCRHMYSVEFIKKFIDQLAYHKLNKFHWHLTDDQGWRIEIKKYPRLQEVAAYRNGTQFIDGRKGVDSIRYGGFYTQQQIKDVVAYAASRYIEVIPEIEMPGHSVAAITAYPYLACSTASFGTGKPFEVRKVWGVSKDLYCAGNDSVFTFLQNVLTEVMQLFPSQYIHIGGDEAPHDAWKECLKCQKRMKDIGLKNEDELQSWFIRRIEKFINLKGKKIIGWEEIMNGGMTKSATIQSWLGVESGLQAAKNGNDAIMSPYSHLYFDGYQGDEKIEPLAIGYWTPLDTVYSFEPVHPALTKEEAKHILGGQGNLWTEFIATEDYFEYMVFPRIAALSEIDWTQKDKRNFDDFKKRLQTQYQRYARQGVHFRIPPPQIQTNYLSADSALAVTLSDPTAKGIIRYSIGENELSENSPVYSVPIKLLHKQKIRFALFYIDGRKSSTDYYPK